MSLYESINKLIETYELTKTINLDLAIYLRNICDEIHSGGEYEGFAAIDLPTDADYERLNSIIELLIHPESMVVNKTELISEMWMEGKVRKSNIIEESGEIILIPKFDGCSCAIKLIRESNEDLFTLDSSVTRGMVRGTEIQRTDITSKVRDIIPEIIEKLNKIAFSIFNNIKQLSIRGEIVLKKSMENTPVPAAFVAGKINGGMDIWNDWKHTMEFVPFEIIQAKTFDDDVYIKFNQLCILDLFKNLNINTFPYKTIINATINDVERYFHEIIKIIPQPLDGIVYCSKDWTYPLRMNRTTPSTYRKFAWKPSVEGRSIVTDIITFIGRDGKFGFTVKYKSISLSGKSYSSSKITPEGINNLPGIGKNAEILIRLANSTCPVVYRVVKSSDNPFKKLEKCPYCNADTEYTTTKVLIARCTNNKCIGILCKSLVVCMKTLKIKGYGEKTIEKLTYPSLKSLNDYIGNNTLIDKIKSIKISEFIISIGICTKSTINKILSVDKLTTIVQHLTDEDIDELLSLCKTEFARESLQYIKISTRS